MSSHSAETNRSVLPDADSLSSPAGNPSPEKQILSPLLGALLSLAAVLAVLLRWHGLGSRSLWWDEGFTEWVSQFSVLGIYRALQVDTGPPLFYILQHYWIQCFGLSDTSLRGMSAFFATLSLPLFYLLARRLLLDAKSVIIACWLFALSPLQIWYSQEARFYALLTFLSLASLYSLIRFLDRRSLLSFCAFVLSLSASLYTHNMMFFYLPALVLVWLLYPSSRTARQRIAEISVAGVSTLILYLPWVPTLWRQTKLVQHTFWVAPPTSSKLADTLLLLAGVFPDYLHALSARLLHLPSQFSALMFSLTVIMVLAIWLGAGIWPVAPADRSKAFALLAYSTVPVFLVFIFSNLVKPVFISRVFIGSSAVLPILLVAPVAFRLGSRLPLRLVVGVALIGLTAISLFGYLRFGQKEDWRSTTRYLLNIPEPNRLILFVPKHGQMLFDYYAAQFPPFSKPDEGGLPENIDLSKPIPPLFLTEPDLIGNLRQAVESRRYSEIDAVISHAPARLADPTREYLSAHCSLWEERDLYQITVIRCLLKKD
jgi:uncharacterized membrane protein